MKKCPQCSRTYSDDTLSFCLEDGALLSAYYNPWETNAPTVAFDAGEAATSAAREIPTSVAQETPTVVANEIPTVVNPTRPTEQTQSVGWKIYLLGLLISFVVDVIYVYVLHPFYFDATQPLFESIAENFDDREVGFIIAATLLTTPLNLFVYTLLAFLLGYIFPRGKWRWGIVALIPNWVITIYYAVINLSGGYSSPVFHIRLIIINIIYTFFTCLFANIGSRLSRKPTA
jgi:hypothetical protein